MDTGKGTFGSREAKVMGCEAADKAIWLTVRGVGSAGKTEGSDQAPNSPEDPVQLQWKGTRYTNQHYWPVRSRDTPEI